MTKLSTDPYKGVRDFYPEDEFIQRYIKDTWREVAERFGYEAYDASVLEPLELYAGKTSDEIVSEQTYQFEDRGGRQVTLRPEMTPTVARMVAGRRRESGFPLRLYSVPNLFRYERPQKGRLREHWQLNCDVFGLDNLDAEVEIILLAVRIMEAFGINQDDFEVRLSDRKLLNSYLGSCGLNKEDQKQAIRLVDRWQKDESARVELEELLKAPFDLEPDEGLFDLIGRLEAIGVTNAIFDRTLARGFDYYTGVVFEVFDKNPENRRALFGGGRYDNLFEIFGQEPILAVGFGMGDVTMRNVLETYNLLPDYIASTDLCLISQNAKLNSFTLQMADMIRAQGLNIETDTTGRKLAQTIKQAEKRNTTFIAVVGEVEKKSNKIKIKHLKSGKEIESDVDSAGAKIQDWLLEQ